jgi:hypothetical protein
MQDFTERQTRLSPDDQKHLKSNLIGMFIFLGIAIAIFYVFYSAIPNDKVVFYVLTGFAALFFGVIFWMIRGYLLDLSNNEKVIIRGFVTDQMTTFHRNSTRVSRRITIGDKKIPVNFQQMASIKTGDFVEVHYGRHSKLAFATIILHSGIPSTGTSSKTYSTTYSNPLKGSIAGVLLDEDRKILAKQYRRSIRFEVYALIFITYLIAGLLFNGLTLVLIFLFPVPFGFIWLSYRIIKKTKLHYEDINSEGVLIYETLATDKSSINSKTAYSYTLVTEAMKLKTGKQVYEKVMPVQPIKIRVSRVHKRLIGVTLPSGDYLANLN